MGETGEKENAAATDARLGYEGKTIEIPVGGHFKLCYQDGPNEHGATKEHGPAQIVIRRPSFTRKKPLVRAVGDGDTLEVFVKHASGDESFASEKGPVVTIDDR